MLGRGDPKVTFVVGAILTFPGVSYLDGLDRLHKLDPGTVQTVLLVIGFCLIQLILAGGSLLGMRSHRTPPRPGSPSSGPGWDAAAAPPR
jgi:hypothetical protein